MSESLPNPDVPRSGYDRVAVEAYFAAADAERARLRAAIDRERARLARARAAVDARRVLAAMVEQACDEIVAKRRQGDLVVQRVVAAGDGTSPIHWQAPTTPPWELGPESAPTLEPEAVR